MKLYPSSQGAPPVQNAKRRLWCRQQPSDLQRHHVHPVCMPVTTTQLQATSSWAAGWGESAAAAATPAQQQQPQRQRQGASGRGRRRATQDATPEAAAATAQDGVRTAGGPTLPHRMVLKRAASVNPADLDPTTGLAVTWLGTSSGTPSLLRNVSCTVVRSPAAAVLVDCGEGSHRQLMTAGIPLHTITNIYITHLHGDHCFGLGSTLAAIDAAKQEALAQQQQQQGGGGGAQVADEGAAMTYVWGPPGTAQLLRSQVVATGAHHSLRCQVLVTELVTDVQDGVLQPQLLAPDCPHILVRRLPPRPMAQVPMLAAAMTAVAPALDAIPQVWRARPWQAARRAPLRTFNTHDGVDGVFDSGEMSDDDAEGVYGGRHYVAEEGLVWDLLPPGVHPTAQGLRCLAAQLQHRVPCWGYALQEVSPPAPGMRRRKVVVLGDTINSRAMGPLAVGCDVLAHEATFIQGMEDKCRIAQHSTGWMAGAFAAAVRARTLVLTHFSARYQRGSEAPRPQRGGPMGGRGRGGPQGGPYRERELSAEEEAAQQTQAIWSLIQEAQAEYPGGHIVAASDFFTLHVPQQPQPHNAAQHNTPTAAAATAGGAAGGKRSPSRVLASTV